MTTGAFVYTAGPCHASVCAPNTAPIDDVLDEANRQVPTGLDHGWMISLDKTFAGGEPNPCPCDRIAGRVHRLLEC